MRSFIGISIGLVAALGANGAGAQDTGTQMLNCAQDLAQKNSDQGAATDKLAEAIAGECMKGHLPESVQALLVGPSPPADLVANEEYIFTTLKNAAAAKLRLLRGEDIKLRK